MKKISIIVILSLMSGIACAASQNISRSSSQGQAFIDSMPPYLKKVAAKEYYFNHNERKDALPDWIAPYFSGVSVQDLIANDKLPQIQKWSEGEGDMLDLSSKNLNSLEGLQEVPGIEEVRAIKLFDNQLTTVPADAFKGLVLHALSLEHNQIATIEPGAFNGLGQLKELALDYNQLQRLQENRLNGLKELEILDISHNQLTQIDPGALSGLKRLKKLSLEENPLPASLVGALRDALQESGVDVSFDDDADASDDASGWLASSSQ